MNQPCSNCGRIITVPDIPLPAGYTQKCTACGHSNVIEDEFSVLESGGMGSTSEEESWEASFDSTMNFLSDNEQMADGYLGESLGEAAAPEGVDDKLRALEARLLDEIQQRLARGSYPNDLSVIQTGQHLVVGGRVLIGTRNSTLYRSCQSILEGAGYQIEASSNLNKVLELLAARRFQVIVLDQQFIAGEAGREVFTYINETPPDIRRAQTVVLITPGIGTCEPQVFYQWGMDLNIHPRDLDSLEHLLAQTLARKNELLATIT